MKLSKRKDSIEMICKMTMTDAQLILVEFA